MRKQKFTILKKRFISLARHKEDRRWQSEIITFITNKYLKTFGQTAELWKFEYFFYTDTTEKAAALLKELESYGYSGSFQNASGNNGMFLINGWTNEIPLSDEGVIKWAEMMCDTGFRFDCEFDGWGTTPQQELL